MYIKMGMLGFQSDLENGQSVFRPKRRQNPTLWAVHTYMAYIREYPRVLTPSMIVRDQDQV